MMIVAEGGATVARRGLPLWATRLSGTVLASEPAARLTRIWTEEPALTVTPRAACGDSILYMLISTAWESGSVLKSLPMA